ncbi:MAG: cytochrome c peroxidase, partial [Chitinophagales bacterium]
MLKIKYAYLCLIAFFSLLAFAACDNDDDSVEEIPKEVAVLDETLYALDYGNLPVPELPEDNPLTVQGVELGRMLFYEKMLSKDGSQACADCHRQLDGFSDSLRL